MMLTPDELHGEFAQIRREWADGREIRFRLRRHNWHLERFYAQPGAAAELEAWTRRAGMGHREALSQAIRDFPLGKRAVGGETDG